MLQLAKGAPMLAATIIEYGSTDSTIVVDLVRTNNLTYYWCFLLFYHEVIIAFVKLCFVLLSPLFSQSKVERLSIPLQLNTINKADVFHHQTTVVVLVVYLLVAVHKLEQTTSNFPSLPVALTKRASHCSSVVLRTVFFFKGQTDLSFPP